MLELGKRPEESAAVVLRMHTSRCAGSEDVKQETATFKATKRSLTRKLSISGVGTRKS